MPGTVLSPMDTAVIKSRKESWTRCSATVLTFCPVLLYLCISDSDLVILDHLLRKV